MKKVILAVTALSGVILLGAASASATLTTTYDSTTDSSAWYSVDTIGDWATDSGLMSGMQVTATFYGGETETVTWTGDSGAVGTDWSFYLEDPEGSTFSTGFTLLAQGDTDIISLLIDGTLGGTFFDVVYSMSDSVSTEGSYRGNSIADSASYSGIDIDAYYFTPVVLGNDNPVYDLYSSLLLTFSSTDSTGYGFTSDNSLTFISDTDNKMEPVPEPSALLLFGVGLSGLVAIRRRKE
jgi:hypothetical protein